MADNGNKPTKGEGVRGRKKVHVQRRNWKIKREEERQREWEEGRENTGKRNEERKWE